VESIGTQHSQEEKSCPATVIPWEFQKLQKSCPVDQCHWSPDILTKVSI
jgi:hypothetical protein